ncbi:MAG: methyltransferase domain-containing protein [Verrucomicrobia bacterium]|nr:methyltransferase domain-containing protein [Verrucomicrobiota bacterium]
MKNDPKALSKGKEMRTRHDKTQMVIKATIGDLISDHASDAERLLEVADIGWQTLFYRSQMPDAKLTMIYDWRDERSEEVKEGGIDFRQVDLEESRFPDEDGSYDVVVCNQVFEHLKNIFLPLSEIHRVLRPGGTFIFSVPNLSALHNVFLTMFGKQPTTIRLAGSHVRSYAIWSMTQFLTYNGHFRVLDLKGVGLHPFTSVRMPGVLRTYCHTPVWALRKEVVDRPNWQEAREATFTTTNF